MGTCCMPRLASPQVAAGRRPQGAASACRETFQQPQLPEPWLQVPCSVLGQGSEETEFRAGSLLLP